MQPNQDPDILIRPMKSTDRAEVADMVASAGNFNQAEIDCALELVDIYLAHPHQNDYRIVVAQPAGSRVLAYACWGPVSLTRGAFDLYWIVTHVQARGRGLGRALIRFVEGAVRNLNGRLITAETSGRASYSGTIEFYRRLGYEEVARIKDFYDIGDDKLIFIKRLS